MARLGSRLTSGWMAALLTLGLTAPAHAHMTVEGAGDLGNGALHPLLTPSHALVLVALGLWLGQRLPLDLKTPVRVFAPVSALALLLTASGRVPEIPPPVLSGVAMAIAVLVGLEKRLPRRGCGLVCAIAALAVGLDSTVETGGGFVVAKMLTGTWLSMNAVMCYLAICASHGAERKWARTGIRVLGSWIIAISLMVLAFALRAK